MTDRDAVSAPLMDEADDAQGDLPETAGVREAMQLYEAAMVYYGQVESFTTPVVIETSGTSVAGTAPSRLSL